MTDPLPSREHFSFRFSPGYQRLARLFGVTPGRASVEVSDGRLDARYGRWRVRTPLSNVRSIEITGPYRFIKTAGPARLGITDRGLTFASNGERGVLIRFHEPVTGIDPFGMLHHPELTVTVSEPAALLSTLRRETSLQDRS